MRLSSTVTEIWDPKHIGVTTLTCCGHVSTSHKFTSLHEFDLLGSRDVIGHVTIGLGICGFLLVIHWNHASISKTAKVITVDIIQHHIDS